jgi:hypothetical protein
MGITKFFSEAIGSAISLGLATHDDVLRHATPDVLAKHLPRPLWSKLISACLASPRTDAKLVVETITMPVLCEHVPPTILWACLDQIGKRVLDKAVSAASAATGTKAAASVASAPAAAVASSPSPSSPPPSSSSSPGLPGMTPAPAAAATNGAASVASVPASLPAPPSPPSPRTTSTMPTMASPANVPTPIATTAATASQPVVVPRAQTQPVVPTSTITPPHGTNITNSRVPTVAGAGASTRRATVPTGRVGGPPAPPPKSARAETEQPVLDVDVEDAQVIDFGGSEETFVGQGEGSPKR